MIPLDKRFKSFYMVTKNMEVKTPYGTQFFEKYFLLDEEEMGEVKNYEILEGFDINNLVQCNLLPHQWDWVRGVRVANPSECFLV